MSNLDNFMISLELMGKGMAGDLCSDSGDRDSCTDHGKGGKKNGEIFKE